MVLSSVLTCPIRLAVPGIRFQYVSCSYSHSAFLYLSNMNCQRNVFSCVHAATVEKFKLTKASYKASSVDPKRHNGAKTHRYLRFRSDTAYDLFMANPDLQALREQSPFSDADWMEEETGLLRFASASFEKGHHKVRF